MFGNLKSVEEPKICICYPTEFSGSAQNPKKIIRRPNLPIKTKISKHSYDAYPTELAGSTQNPKKIIGTSNLSINENYPKKSIFSTLKV
jgi:hypothetical protein